MIWRGEISRYVHSPHASWPPDRPLQARKLEEHLVRQCATREVTRTDIVQRFSDVAQRRIHAGARTLFLINCGSSGSHWVEAMLAALPGVHACGEVYVPPQIAGELATLDQGDRACFLDVLHQVHVEPAANIGEDDVLINSAHSWNPHDLMGGLAIAILLVRDPIDIVASRTFRKPKFRRHVEPAADDDEYLERNTAMVEKFYRSALRRRAEHVVRYEDIRDRPVEALARMAALIGRAAPSGVLEAIVARYSAQGQLAGDQRLSNVFRGARTAIPASLLDRAVERLGSLRTDLGYG